MDIFKTPTNNNGANIIKVIRPGSDEYNDVHNTNRKLNNLNLSNYKEIDPDTKEMYDDTISKMLDSDIYIDKFIEKYIEYINSRIISGKSVSQKAYGLYNLFKRL